MGSLVVGLAVAIGSALHRWGWDVFWGAPTLAGVGLAQLVMSLRRYRRGQELAVALLGVAATAWAAAHALVSARGC